MHHSKKMYILSHFSDRVLTWELIKSLGRPTSRSISFDGENISFDANLVVYCAGGKIEKNEMGGACGAYGGGERCAQGFGGEA